MLPPPQLSRPYTHASHSGMSLCSRVGARKVSGGGNVSPSRSQIHTLCKEQIGHGEYYSNLKSAGTSWAWAFTRHSGKSFTCIIILIFTSTLWSGNYCSHYRAEETEAQKDRNSLKVSLLVNSRARIQFKYPSLTPKRLVNGRREKDTTNHFKALSVFKNWYNGSYYFR